MIPEPRAVAKVALVGGVVVLVVRRWWVEGRWDAVVSLGCELCGELGLLCQRVCGY